MNNKKSITLLLVILLTGNLSGCASIIAATTDEQLQTDETGRSIGNFFDDQQIETVTTVNIKNFDSDLKKDNISVVSYNGVVLLVGQVGSAEERTQVGAIARKVKGVRLVHNQLSIKGNISTLAKTNDSWLTTKVKTKLATVNDIDVGDIKVVTEDSVVYLMGRVTEIQANLAVEKAQATGGVSRIVKVFEYIK